MEMPEKKKLSWLTIIKNLFWILVILQLAPSMLMNVKKGVQEIFFPKQKIGLLPIKGMISDSSFTIKKLGKFLKADDVKGLLIRIDSPGGYPGSGHAIFSEVKRFSQQKPVVVMIENSCASAAYLIACGASMIVATPASMVGSIGAFMRIPDAKGFMNDWKVDMHHIASGEYKTAGSPFKFLTSEEQKYLQEVCDDSYEQFVEDVAKSRGLDMQQSSIWANGKVMMAPKALKLGLIDQLGSPYDALEELKKIAGIQGDVKIVEVQQPFNLKSLLFGRDESDNEMPGFAQQTASFLHAVWGHFCRQQSYANQIYT